jgi:hypothetical protein
MADCKLVFVGYSSYANPSDDAQCRQYVDIEVDTIKRRFAGSLQVGMSGTVPCHIMVVSP